MASFEHRQEHEREARTTQIGRTHAEQEVGLVERVAASIGNQAFGIFAREGAGILPGGRAHPDVEATIARTRGSGVGLDAGARDRFGPALGDSLEDVRVHTDETADALSRSVSARAFTTGSDLYFARGHYRPDSQEGERLLAHELTHVVQQRGAPGDGPLVVSEPGDALETEAEGATDELVS
jgi:hypothetical protein